MENNEVIVLAIAGLVTGWLIGQYENWRETKNSQIKDRSKK